MHYRRLSALDRSFLDIEKRTTHMHVALALVFDAAPLATADGGIDIERLRTYVESRLHLIPRFRQRLAYTPLEGHPIWVDDDEFNLRYHVRHTSLPRPGTERQLKRLIGWINSQQLDRHKPLWEMWVVEGLEGNRFAVINKAHHCMVDGVSGADSMPVLLTAVPTHLPDEPTGWYPSPSPGPLRTLRDAVLRRTSAPFVVAARMARALVSDPRALLGQAADIVGAAGDLVYASLVPGSETPFNRAISGNRRFDWVTFDLDEVKAVKNALGGSVNDVVLAVVAGAVARFLDARGLSPSHDKNFHFRAFCPVSRHSAVRRNFMGNKVSGMLTELPVGALSARQRLERVRETTAALKDSYQVRGTELIELVADWFLPQLMGWVANMGSQNLVYNMVVTNVPGPQLPLYLLDARLLEAYPVVPLFGNQGLGIALFSYDGKLFWGFSGDRDMLPDLHDFVRAIEEAFAELRDVAAAAVVPASAAGADVECAVAGASAARSESHPSVPDAVGDAPPAPGSAETSRDRDAEIRATSAWLCDGSALDEEGVPA